MRLRAVRGPFAGQDFPLREGANSVGRALSCDIALADGSVSRQHCLIEVVDGRAILRDLQSHNRTRVNGETVAEHKLSDGDSVEIGRSTLIFTTRDDAEAFTPSATLVLRPEEVTTPPAVEHLRVLLAAGRLTSSESRLDRYIERVLELVAGEFPVDSAAVILGVENDPASWRRRELSRLPASGFALPGSIIRRVLRERVSLWCNDVLDDPGLEATESVLQARLAAVLAVPLIVGEQLIGVLAAATNLPGTRFSEEQLHLLTAIGAMVAGGIRNLDRVEFLQAENRRLQDAVVRESNLIGETDCMRAVHAFIAKVAPGKATVLITGESGTGKELVARAIHRSSPRRDRPFTAINCANLSETLLESELFGHEKGAFTGAVALQKGKFEEAHTGTIFLDEIGEMNAALQARLLRVLQEREFERIGGNVPIQVDVRVVAASNRDLAAMSKAGTFRSDLYYRINVVSIQMPALRQRRDDIPLLARHLLEKHSRHVARRVTGISSRALDLLRRYDWPGNVRELENVIERALVLGSAESILPEDLPEYLLETNVSANTTGDFHERVNEAKRDIVRSALEEAGGNYVDAARILGIHPNNLHRLVRNLGLRDRR